MHQVIKAETKSLATHQTHTHAHTHTLFIHGHAPLLGRCHQPIPETLGSWDGLVVILFDDEIPLPSVILGVDRLITPVPIMRDVPVDGNISAIASTPNSKSVGETRHRILDLEL